MSVSDKAGTSRQLVASAEMMSTAPPSYVLSAADWLTLVEKFGLTANVSEAARKG